MTGVDDPFGRAMGPYILATASAVAGRPADARRLALEGMHDSDRAGDTFARGLLNTVLGIVEWLSGDPQAAEATIKEAVRLQDRIGHRWGMANEPGRIGLGGGVFRPARTRRAAAGRQRGPVGRARKRAPARLADVPRWLRSGCPGGPGRGPLPRLLGAGICARPGPGRSGRARRHGSRGAPRPGGDHRRPLRAVRARAGGGTAGS